MSPDAGAPAVATTVQQAAIGWLRRAIAEGELVPGERIGQEAVAERIGVSLIPVREALRVLESEGLVTYRPRRGYFVTELHLADLEEIYRLRRLLETDAVERGVPVATAEDVARMEEAAAACAAAGAAGDVTRRLAENRRFHFALYALARSAQLQRIVGLLWDSTEAYRAVYYGLPGEGEAADRAHRAIIAAVWEGDVERTVRELDAHRERALERLRAVLPVSG